MKILLSRIWSTQAALPKLLVRDLPTKAAYWLGRNASKIEAELKIMNDTRITLVKKFGTQDEKSKDWRITPDKTEEFEQEFKKLMDTEIDINITQLTLADFGDTKLSGGEISAIDYMLKE